MPVSTPHKGTLTVAVIDHAGCAVTQLQLPNQDSGYLPPAGCADQPRGDVGGHGRSGNFGWPAAIYLLERDPGGNAGDRDRINRVNARARTGSPLPIGTEPFRQGREHGHGRFWPLLQYGV